MISLYDKLQEDINRTVKKNTKNKMLLGLSAIKSVAGILSEISDDVLNLKKPQAIKIPFPNGNAALDVPGVLQESTSVDPAGFVRELKRALAWHEFYFGRNAVTFTNDRKAYELFVAGHRDEDEGVHTEVIFIENPTLFGNVAASGEREIGQSGDFYVLDNGIQIFVKRLDLHWDDTTGTYGSGKFPKGYEEELFFYPPRTASQLSPGSEHIS